MSVLRYQVSAPIVLVTPNGRLGTTATSVLNAATGAVLGPLSTTGTVQAVSPDSKTLYVVDGNNIVKVDLSSY